MMTNSNFSGRGPRFPRTSTAHFCVTPAMSSKSTTWTRGSDTGCGRVSGRSTTNPAPCRGDDTRRFSNNSGELEKTNWCANTQRIAPHLRKGDTSIAPQQG